MISSIIILYFILGIALVLNKCVYIDVYKISVRPVHIYSRRACVLGYCFGCYLEVAMHFLSFFFTLSLVGPIVTSASVPREHIIYALCYEERRQTVHYTHRSIVCRRVHTSKRTYCLYTCRSYCIYVRLIRVDRGAIIIRIAAV